MDKEPPENEIPEFKSDYIKAFISILLFKTGGHQTITLDMLERFDPEKEGFDLIWEPKLKAFTLILKGFEKKKRKRGIVNPKRKLILPSMN